MKKFIGVGALALIAVGTFAAWYFYNAGVEFSSIMPSKTKLAAPAEQGAVDQWWRPPTSEEAAWRVALVTACASGKTSLQVTQIDVDGDGKADRVCTNIRRSAIYGDYVEVAAHVVDKDGKAQNAYTALPTLPEGSTDGSHGEPPLIGVGGVVVQSDILTKESIGELDTEGHIGRCIRLTTDTGDHVWLFWVPDAKTDEERFFLQTPFN